MFACGFPFRILGRKDLLVEDSQGHHNNKERDDDAHGAPRELVHHAVPLDSHAVALLDLGEGLGRVVDDKVLPVDGVRNELCAVLDHHVVKAAAGAEVL